MIEHNTFEEFYNEFKDWNKKDILKRIYDTTLIINKEVERLNENNQHMQEEMVRTWEKHDNLQSRIDKAIKYIEEHSHNSYFSMLQADYNMSLNVLLDILKGKNNE